MNKTTYRFHLGLQGRGLFPRFRRGTPSPPSPSLSLSASKGSCAIIHCGVATLGAPGSPEHQARSYDASCNQRTLSLDSFRTRDLGVSSRSGFISKLQPVTSSFLFFGSARAIF
jgi:hypothetical protein